MAATTAHLKIQTQFAKPKRRRYRETTITTSTSAAATTITTHSPFDTNSSTAGALNHQDNHYQQHRQRQFDPPRVVSPENSWCCPASKLPPPPPASPPPNPVPISSLFPSESPSSVKIRYSPCTLPQVMDSIPIANGAIYGGASTAATHDAYPSSFSKFNSALTAGLLNPMSPPPSVDKTRSSPTLFEMMASEPDCLPRTQIHNLNAAVSAPKPQPPPLDKQALMQQRLSDLLACRSPGNQFNDPNSSDVKLNLSAKDGLTVSMNVHRQILVAHSRFFAVNISDRWSKQQRSPGPYIVEIADCDDIEIYIETLRLMYCKDLRKKLMKEDVPRVLGILKVSAAIGFDAGVLSCLEYLEAAPWAEDEEQKVASLLSELRLEGAGAGEVLKRVSLDVLEHQNENANENEEVLLKLLRVVLEGKDEKARREMKTLVLKMLKENSSQNDLRKESLYSACNGCLNSLRFSLSRAAGGDMQDVNQIARQADNLHWILDILIDRQIAEDFLKMWGSQFELAKQHSTVPAIYRYEVSKITARFFVGIGKGQLLASKDARCLLLQTWLGAFYDDFGWIVKGRAHKGLDRHLIEDGLSNTILTLPMNYQKEILMSWFDRFLNSGEDCPNIQRGFEVWWRRAFWKRNGRDGESRRQIRTFEV